jgi:outer membrane protein assembly factor BamB
MMPEMAFMTRCAFRLLMCFSFGLLLTAVACNGDSGVGPRGDGLVLQWGSRKTDPGPDWVGGTPAIDGGRVFVQDGNQLMALDAATGKRLWSRAVRIAHAPPPTTLRAADGVVYLSETDSIMAVNGATGATLWTVHPDSQTVVEPALDASTFYTGQRGIPVVYAVARADGTVRWKANLGVGYQFLAHVHGVAVSGDTVYATVERYLNLNGAVVSGVLVALASEDGHELWRYETPGTHDFLLNAPLAVGRLVLVNDFYGGYIIAIDMLTHHEVWRASGGGSVGLAVVGQTLLSAGFDHTARGIDLATGAVKWTTDTGSSAFGIGTCGNNFYVSAFQLRRYDVASGQLTGKASLGVTDGGWVSYVANDGGNVYVAGTAGVAAYRCG